jgi:lipopolysaccharide/colanic/teichoic acid biosynthesis glycosyltransferase
MLVIAILVKIKMPGGPVFFVQKRVGKEGELFNCHKFRTMIVKHSGSSVSVAGDSRITPLGATLRRYHIDELPGLWYVLIGKMSFVGPRPDVPGYADKLEGADRDVLKLYPGITGPATLKYRDEDEMIASFVDEIKEGKNKQVSKFVNAPDFSKMSDQEIAMWYNDNIIYPDKVRLNCHYYHNYSCCNDLRIIFATVLGNRILYAGEKI